MLHAEQHNQAMKLDCPGHDQHSRRLLPTRVKNICEKQVQSEGCEGREG